MFLKEHLISWGCRPDDVPDALFAIKKLYEAKQTKDTYQVALLDMSMP